MKVLLSEAIYNNIKRRLKTLKEDYEISNEEYENLLEMFMSFQKTNMEIAEEIAKSSGIPLSKIIYDVFGKIGSDIDHTIDGVLWYVDVIKNEVTLDSRNLSYIPRGFLNIPTIKFLDTSLNNLSELPNEIGNLQDLEGLFLMNNQLALLPDAIGNCEKLQFFNIAKNKLSKLPKTFSKLIHIKVLDLHKNNFNYFPTEILSLPKISELDLSNNKITEIPSEISNLDKLKDLYMTSNKITSIPESIGNMRSLRYINFSNNNISVLPESIYNLEYCSFDFSMNPLSPETIEKLKKYESETNLNVAI